MSETNGQKKRQNTGSGVRIINLGIYERTKEHFQMNRVWMNLGTQFWSMEADVIALS